MKIIAETHSHTIASMHAYSTLLENAQAAKEKGLSFLCCTDHGPAMPGGPHVWYFDNLWKEIPDTLCGIAVLKGAEADIMNFNGELDIPDDILKKLDWVIASYHVPCCAPGTKEECTRGWLAIAENPHVDVIGHCGDGRYPFDYDVVIPAFARAGKIVEINSHSFLARPGSSENCREIAEKCKKYGVRVTVGTDAHFVSNIGNVQEALKMLQEVDFPQELVVNASLERFRALAKEKTGRDFK